MTRQSAKSVLLVEDNDDLREPLAQLFRLAGWSVKTAVDGMDGLRQLAEDPPDVIITDYMMPTLDGCEMISSADSDPHIRKIPVVVVTAALRVPSPLVERAAATVAKPASFASLDKLLHELVD